MWLNEEEALDRTKWNSIMISNTIPATPCWKKKSEERKKEVGFIVTWHGK